MSGQNDSWEARDSTIDGQAHALKSLSVRLRVPLKRYFEKHAVPRDEVDDMVQEVFVRLAGRAGLESNECLDAYVFKSASNLLRDRHRRRMARAAGFHEAYDEEIHGTGLPSFEPERSLLGAQSLQQMVTALYELPEKTRGVFVLYHLEGLSHQEIGRQLGMAVSTIEKHMSRANAYILKRVDR
ncbi:MAG: sigma-70 family RNA polymerase sigma factor [Gammaproteobacteria bacterium]